LRRAVLAAFLVLGAAAAQAEVYSWRDASGAKRISNVAPPWYTETGRTGPRVQVLINGILVDDTGVPEEQRAKLREQRAKAEAWGTRKPAASTTPAAQAAAPTPPAADLKAKPPPPPVPPGGIDGAKTADGLKRAQESRKEADAPADQLKATGKPK
jgi:hypothetical protein